MASPNILSDRTNTQTQQNANPFQTKDLSNKGAEPTKPKTMDYHRQMMENKLKAKEGEAEQAYVSPSDAIMSPASQKLSGFKQRQMNKQMGAPVKSRSLFANVMTAREKDLGSEKSLDGSSN